MMVPKFGMLWSWRMLLLCSYLIDLTPLCFAAETSDPASVVSADAKITTTPSTPATPKSSSTATDAALASKTSSAPPKTVTISVGNGEHKFKPDTVQANIGDTIEFDFYPQNHSVVRAEYKYPCIPYEMTGPNKTGFFSTFHPVDTVLDDPPKWTLKINDTEPLFFYCSAPGSCITYGMVGVINPNSSVSLDTQRKMAMDSDYMLNPGEPFPAESPLPTSSSSATSSSAGGHSSKLSTGATAGIVIACVGVVVLGSLLFFFWGRFRGLRDEMKRKDSTIKRTTSPHSPDFFTSPFATNNHTHTQSSANGPFDQPSPPYTATPMTAHASPIPPSYFSTPTPIRHNQHTPYPHPHPQPDHARNNRLSRATSHRSVGGTFDLSPTTGYYTRTHNGADASADAAPRTSDMTSPVDPKLIPVGAYGRQVDELRRMVLQRSPDSGHAMPKYGGDAGGMGTTMGRPLTYHVNQAQGPAEMDDTSVKPPGGFF